MTYNNAGRRFRPENFLPRGFFSWAIFLSTGDGARSFFSDGFHDGWFHDVVVPDRLNKNLPRSSEPTSFNISTTAGLLEQDAAMTMEDHMASFLYLSPPAKAAAGADFPWDKEPKVCPDVLRRSIATGNGFGFVPTQFLLRGRQRG